MNLERPDTELFSNLAFVWVLANYFPLGDFDVAAARRTTIIGLRCLTIMLASWGLSGWSRGWQVAVPLCAATAILLIVRDRLAKRYQAELELVNLGVLLGLMWILRHSALSLHPFVRIHAPPNGIPALLLVGSLCSVLVALIAGITIRLIAQTVATGGLMDAFR